jgi:hypothetical protein
VLDLDDCMAMHRQEHGMNQYGWAKGHQWFR